jgi:transposase-like protein
VAASHLEDRYQNEDAARDYLEAQRWPNGPVCPHCGNCDPKRVKALQGKAHRRGLYQCKECDQQFTVTVGTVFERSKIPLHKWLFCTHLINSSKKGISSHQLHRMLGVTYKTAWFMAHRIRLAMADHNPSGPLGGKGKVVEADETYFGSVDPAKVRTVNTQGRPFTKSGKPGPSNKRAVVALVERGAETRMFHVPHATADEVRTILLQNVAKESALHTDESRLYTSVGATFGDHQTVKHSAGEYVRYQGDVKIHSNTVENVFSVFKRGMKGVYQHCAEKHLHRYLSEFEFRYNRRSGLGFTDTDRTDAALRGIGGKRLTYRRVNEARL